MHGGAAGGFAAGTGCGGGLHPELGRRPENNDTGSKDTRSTDTGNTDIGSIGGIAAGRSAWTASVTLITGDRVEVRESGGPLMEICRWPRLDTVPRRT